MLQNALLDVQFVLQWCLFIHLQVILKPCCTELRCFGIGGVYSTFPVTFNALQFRIVMVSLGHLAEVIKGIIFIKASEKGQMIFNEIFFLLCFNYKLHTTELKQVWSLDLYTLGKFLLFISLFYASLFDSLKQMPSS